MNDWKAKDAAKAVTAAALAAANPHLIPVGGKVNSLNAAAKNMRIELKRAFPTVKFSVKSERYSGGNSITVGWVDGPVGSLVSDIIGKYKAGYFDGQDDCYNYTAGAWNAAFGDAKYVSTNRDDSDKALESAIRTIKAKWFDDAVVAALNLADLKAGQFWSLYPVDGFARDSIQTMVYRVARSRTWALPVGVKFVEMEEVAA